MLFDLVVKFLIAAPGETFPVENFSSGCHGGLRWSWGAFVLPEFWFLWNEMWGADLLIVVVEIVFAKYAYMYFGIVGLALFFVSIRIITGLFGKTLLSYKNYRFGRHSS